MSDRSRWDSARDEPPFSNGTEGYGWMHNWCDRCLRDAPFRNGLTKTGCELLLIALVGKTPAEWLDGPRDEHGRYSVADQYHCIEFRAPGSGSSDPRPKPTPSGQGELLPRAQVAGRRTLTPLELAPDLAQDRSPLCLNSPPTSPVTWTATSPGSATPGSPHQSCAPDTGHPAPSKAAPGCS